MKYLAILDDVHARVTAGAHRAATSPHNSLREPTPAQADSGNYRKGRFTLHGLPIVIENPAGTVRRGIGADGKAWATRVAAHYGDISGTRGADGDPVDVFVGPFPESTQAWVINQRHPGGGFDEHKVMIGFGNEDMARQAYLGSYEPGWANLQSIIPATIGQLKTWLKRGDTSRPFTPTDTDMDKIVWNKDAQPVTTTMPKLIYGLRTEDAGGLLLDSVTLPELLDDPDIEAAVLDALVVPVARMTQRMDLLKRAMNAAGTSLTVTDYTIADPVRLRGTLQVAVLFALSDGQAVTIWFHNPDTTPAKLTPMDDLVSWKWMLNKKDITLVVAPERGVELNPREVARRVMRLADRNSDAFKKSNSKLAEKQAALAALDTEIDALNGTLTELRGKIDVAQAARAAADKESARVAAETPSIQEVADIIAKWDRNPALWSNALTGAKLLNAAKLGWVVRPSTSQLQWTDSGVAAYRAMIDLPSTLEEPKKTPGTARADWEFEVFSALTGLTGVSGFDYAQETDERVAALESAWDAQDTPDDAAKAIVSAVSVIVEPVAAVAAAEEVIDPATANITADAKMTREDAEDYLKERGFSGSDIDAILSDVAEFTKAEIDEAAANFSHKPVAITAGEHPSAYIRLVRWKNPTTGVDRIYVNGMGDSSTKIWIEQKDADNWGSDFTIRLRSESRTYGEQQNLKNDVERMLNDWAGRRVNTWAEVLTLADGGKLSAPSAVAEEVAQAVEQAGTAAAVAALEVARDVAATNEPINRAEGDTEQANLEAKTVEQIDNALETLKNEAMADAGDVAADRAYLTSLIDGSGDLTAPDVYDRLEPLFDKYATDAEMSALVDKAADAFSARALTDAQSVL